MQKRKAETEIERNHIMLKFENVDIIKSLKAIMQTNTKNYQSDFNMDIKTLTKAVKKHNYEDKIYLWMSRPEGTWCLQEGDTFIKGTWEYNTFCYYGENTRDKILVYAVEITGMEKRRVMGNIYKLDYQKYYRHVKEVSVERGDVKLIYKNGERMQAAEKHITGADDPNFGKFLSFKDQPKDSDALRSVLHGEKCNRNHFKPGDINAHIKMLSVQKY